jgi:hypothetical protein
VGKEKGTGLANGEEGLGCIFGEHVGRTKKLEEDSGLQRVEDD